MLPRRDKQRKIVLLSKPESRNFPSIFRVLSIFFGIFRLFFLILSIFPSFARKSRDPGSSDPAFSDYFHIWRNFKYLHMTDVEKSEILHILHVCDVENVAT